ncbi:MAG TPA: pyrimidine-nucleoside phosphorylase [Candidatus Mediterraneibacter faecigallinarum]|uniref:Pyrimidine-nucleoside phosphorylase n=1 Tax=Candidatus Mediterraneibacter faecigallinarum TaxID=2838669 RepID=A0A9D2NVW0_9FIRM|nr:pyrimidine-nucleoside phosphorylase [Candidatus Mediterraneibacter faecigallinarum]
MNMYDLIVKKKRGGELAKDEIDWMIREYTAGRIPDYQMSAMMMAVCFVGMSAEETKDLTLAMAHSGDMLDLSAISGTKVDKHSTGGVGDKTSLVLAPLVASLGVPVAKMSGRGLGHTGGTIDKLESFTGFHTDLTPEQFVRNVNTIHIAIAGQTANLAPADKKLYALRDVTGTVDQMSLIASSIMSKKLASGADGIVLDVKTGDGAFMKSLDDARALAEEMVSIGRLAGKDVSAVISDMDQPLGNAVGNALEVKEAIRTLKGQGPEDLERLVLVLGSLMAVKAGKAENTEEAERLLRESLESGRAFEVFKAFIRAQGGDPEEAEHPELLPSAAYQESVCAEADGFVSNIHTEEIGRICLLLGGGRQTKESAIDLSVGLVLCKKKGDAVKKGDPLAVIHASDPEKLSEAKKRLLESYEFTPQKPEVPPLIKDIIS